MTREQSPRDDKPETPRDRSGYAEQTTERNTMGRGDGKPRDRGAYRIDGQDPGYGPRATDPDDPVRSDVTRSSEHGGRRTAGDRAAATADDAASTDDEQPTDHAGNSG